MADGSKAATHPASSQCDYSGLPEGDRGSDRSSEEDEVREEGESDDF